MKWKSTVNKWLKIHSKDFFVEGIQKICFSMEKMGFKEKRLYWKIKQIFFLCKMWVIILQNLPYLLEKDLVLFNKKYMDGKPSDVDLY